MQTGTPLDVAAALHNAAQGGVLSYLRRECAACSLEGASMIVSLEHYRSAIAARRNASDANQRSCLFLARAWQAHRTADPADIGRVAILNSIAAEYERLAEHYGDVAERHERAARVG